MIFNFDRALGELSIFIVYKSLCKPLYKDGSNNYTCRYVCKRAFKITRSSFANKPRPTADMNTSLPDTRQRRNYEGGWFAGEWILSED